MIPQTIPPMIVAHRTDRIPRLRRYPVPIWTNDSKMTKKENSQNVGAAPQWCEAAREPDQRGPGVLQQPGQAHGQPGSPDNDPPGIAEDLPVGFTDPEHPAG